jgi:hypothetical protein
MSIILDNITYSYNTSTKTATLTNIPLSSLSITIPSTIFINNESYSITSIADYAIANSVNLQLITIPTSVTNIGSGAFQNCRSLTSIIIPYSVTDIGPSAFADCRSLNTVSFGGIIPPIRIATFRNIYVPNVAYYSSITTNYNVLQSYFNNVVLKLPPIINSISPSFGYTYANTLVTINGTDLSNSIVTFDNSPINVIDISDTVIHFNAPPHPS